MTHDDEIMLTGLRENLYMNTVKNGLICDYKFISVKTCLD